MAAEQPLDHELILAAARDYVDKSNRGEVGAFWQLTHGRLLNACLVL
jgi:hypothetical protein